MNVFTPRGKHGAIHTVLHNSSHRRRKVPPLSNPRSVVLRTHSRHVGTRWRRPETTLGAVTASLFATTRMAHFGPKSVPGAAPRRLRRWSPCGHTSSDRDTSGRLRYAETVNCTLPMSPGTSGEPHAVAVNERIHTEGAPRGHSHCSSQLFTPSPQSATAVKSERGSVESTLPACRNPLETS